MTNSADVLLQAPPTHTLESSESLQKRDVLLQAPPTQPFVSSESLQKEMHQGQTNTNTTTVKVCLMCIPGSRTQKYGNGVPSSQGSTAINNQAPLNQHSGWEAEGAAVTPSLNLSQTRPTSATQTTSLPGTATATATATVANNDQTLPNNDCEVGSQSTATVDAVKMSETTATVDALKMSETTTSVAIPTQSTALPATTNHVPAPENDVSNKSVVNPAQSSPITDNGNQRVDSVCKRCQCQYEKDEQTSDVEEWLYIDMCTNCQNDIILHHRSISSFQSPKNHPEEEEEVNSCCCC